MHIQSMTNAGRFRNPFSIGVALIAIACVASLFLSTLAEAQSVPGQINISWTLPTTGCTVTVTPCDNKPLTGADALTAVEVYIASSPIADSSTMPPTLTLAAGATTTTHTMQVANGSTLYARLKVRNASGPSFFTTQVSRPVQAPVLPGVPTNVVIDLTIG